MLRSIIEYAKLSASTVAGRIVGGAIVVVPFSIAALFTLAAIYMALRNSYGDLTAAVILAVAFAIIGVIAAIVVTAWIGRQDRLLEERKAEAQQSAFSAALLAVNPALVLGAGRIAFGLFRRAPVLTAVLPLAAGFVLAMASARERRRAASAANMAATRRSQNGHRTASRTADTRELVR